MNYLRANLKSNPSANRYVTIICKSNHSQKMIINRKPNLPLQKLFENSSSTKSRTTQIISKLIANLLPQKIINLRVNLKSNTSHNE